MFIRKRDLYSNVQENKSSTHSPLVITHSQTTVNPKCVAVCCSVLQCVTVITHSQTTVNPKSIQDSVRCSVLQCVAVRYSRYT